MGHVLQIRRKQGMCCREKYGCMCCIEGITVAFVVGRVVDVAVRNVGTKGGVIREQSCV